MNITNYNLEVYVLEVQALLEVIFDKYNNGRSFIRKPVYFIYKNSIKFVPDRIKGEVQELFDLLKLLEAGKEVMDVLNNLSDENGMIITGEVKKLNR